MEIYLHLEIMQYNKVFFYVLVLINFAYICLTMFVFVCIWMDTCAKIVHDLTVKSGIDVLIIQRS